MQTIKAQVSQRLLSKSTRLFTGTLAGRIIEILQNARRASSTQVTITNHEGSVTVCDDGRGIDDFARLLDLGNSGWDQNMEEAEDPAGVGVFCLAPREVKISSGQKAVVITGKAWTGELVPVLTTTECVQGTMFQFSDEPWTCEEVERHTVFSGVQVTVDGALCAQEPFVTEQAKLHPELGCKIEICERNALSKWHNRWKRNYYRDDVLINFHGQVVQFSYRPVSEELQVLVDLTGEPTAIRMMLPARTQIVENQAIETLKSLIEKEIYRFIKKRGSHQLKYAEYCRAMELGIDLPEATPAFQVGLLYGEASEPVEVVKPEDFPLSQCYLMGKQCRGEINEANVHLLAAQGRFSSPFVPVEISPHYHGYSWARLSTVTQVIVHIGKELFSQYVWQERLTAVDGLAITVHTSDATTFSSPVPMAVRKPIPRGNESICSDTEVLVTPEASERLNLSDIWYHLGGCIEDGDTYDTQLYRFEELTESFWAQVHGPGKYLRARLLDCLHDFDLDWQSISIDANQIVTISYKDGHQDVYPQSS